jgi:hypothetical protein
VLYHICVRKPVLGRFAVGTGIVSSHILLNTHLPELGPCLVFCFMSSKASSGVIREVEMVGACGTYGGIRNMGFGIETSKRETLEHVGLDDRIILNWIKEMG